MTRHTSTDRKVKGPVADPSVENGDGRLPALLREQRDLYLRLKALSSRQSELIAGSDTQALLELLNDRQAIVNQLSELSERIGCQPEQLASIASDLPESERELVRSLLKEMEELLQAIITRDDDDRRELSNLFEQKGRQISQVNRMGPALHAYRTTPSSTPPRFTDSKG